MRDVIKRSIMVGLLLFAAWGEIEADAADPFQVEQAEDLRVHFVKNGEPAAIIVIADNPTPVANYASQELVRHVKKASGVELEVINESDDASRLPHRVYVGGTEALKAQGIHVDALGPDTFVLRTIGANLYIAGNEQDDQEPLDEANPFSGTLFGVYEVLERAVGVRWLWPGELGTYVPSSDHLSIEELDEVIKPALQFRRFRWSNIRKAANETDVSLDRLAFSPDVLRSYAADLNIYLRRHRMGDSEPKPNVGHYFQNWWPTHGQENPEWFMLNEQGERGPISDSTARYTAMCVSNPDLHRYIVEKDWNGGNVLRLGEVDRRVFCHCNVCLEWDEPQTEVPEFAKSITELDDSEKRLVTSNRYARFWKTIQAMASERNPDVRVTTFLYWNYMPAPTNGIALNANIYGEFVPWGEPRISWYPMTAQADQWLREQWLGWRNTGITMAYRPNYMHDGYVMPHVETRQSGEFFKFAYEHGMIGVDVDALTGQWATQGPKIYLHMRLISNPELEIDQIRDEYFSAFGPAAGHVEQYFEYWEDYSHTIQDHLVELYKNIGNRWQRFVIMAHRAYPPDVFSPAEDILQEALSATEGSTRPEYAERVKFLIAGLEHARLAASLAAAFNGARDIPSDDEERLSQARDALEDLIRHRRAYEHTYISDFLRAAHHERKWLRTVRRLEDELESVR